MFVGKGIKSWSIRGEETLLEDFAADGEVAFLSRGIDIGVLELK